MYPFCQKDDGKKYKSCTKDVKKMYRFSLKLEYINALANVKRSETFDEMARDEARHGRALEGLLKRYFK